MDTTQLAHAAHSSERMCGPLGHDYVPKVVVKELGRDVEVGRWEYDERKNVLRLIPTTEC